MNNISKDELIGKIVVAFSEIEYPGDENIVEQSYGEELDLVRNHKAFRFYIPAFMIADINEKLYHNDPTVRLCWSVTPEYENEKIAEMWGGGTVGQRAKECFDQFSALQFFNPSQFFNLNKKLIPLIKN